MTDAAAKSPAQIAHEQRNADRKAQAAQAKAGRIDAHRRRNFKVSVEALERRDQRLADHEARNEAAALAAATRAFAEAIEASHGIPANISAPANDNAVACVDPLDELESLADILWPTTAIAA